MPRCRARWRSSGDGLTPRLDGADVVLRSRRLQYWVTASRLYRVRRAASGGSRLWTVFLRTSAVCRWCSGGRAGLMGGAVRLAPSLAALCVSPYFGIVGHLNMLDAAFSFSLAGSVFVAYGGAKRRRGRSQDARRWMLVDMGGGRAGRAEQGYCRRSAGRHEPDRLFVSSSATSRPWKRLHLATGSAAVSGRSGAVVYRGVGAQPGFRGVLFHSRALLALSDQRGCSGSSRGGISCRWRCSECCRGWGRS